MRNFGTWRAVMRSMKLFLSLVLTVVATSSQAIAGLTYDFSTSSRGLASQTIAGNVKAEGKNIRIDIATGDGIPLRIHDSGTGRQGKLNGRRVHRHCR